MLSNISILIATKNEEQDLPGCLESVSWSDDIHVFDSGSTDSTLHIAAQYGARVTSKTYDGNVLAFGGDESGHRNWGLQNIPFKYQWVFQLDADERLSLPLRDEILARINATDCVAFKLRRRDYLQGTWLRHVQASPYYIRLYRPSYIRYERLINPVSIVDGQIGELVSYYDHFPFSKGLTHWITKHNHYSSLESMQIVGNRTAQSKFSILRALIEKDFHQRRYHQKELFYRLPFRPLIKFLLLYIGKRGFLDGRAGFTYAMLQSIYEYFIVLKTRELENAAKNSTYS